MLVKIKNMRMIYDILLVDFTNGYTIYITFTRYMDGQRIDITINNTLINDVYKPFIEKISSMLVDNIVSGYIGLPVNDTTYHALLDEVGEFAKHLKDNDFENLNK